MKTLSLLFVFFFSLSARADLAQSLPGNWKSSSVACENADDLLQIYKGKALTSTMAVAADGNVSVDLYAAAPGKNPSVIGYTAVIAVKGEDLVATSVWLKTAIPLPLPAIYGKLLVTGQDRIRVVLYHSPICGFGTSVSDFFKAN